MLADLPPAKVTALPPDTVIVQFTPAQLGVGLAGALQQPGQQQQQLGLQQDGSGMPVEVVPGEPTMELRVWRHRVCQ